MPRAPSFWPRHAFVCLGPGEAAIPREVGVRLRASKRQADTRLPTSRIEPALAKTTENMYHLEDLSTKQTG